VAVNERRWSAPIDAGALATCPVGTRFRAVQQDIAVTVVDWPVVQAWSEDDPWERDWLGRRAAPVTRAHAPARQRTR
jgi:hypothetical protein